MDTITTRIRALAAEMTASHTFGPAEVENTARELRSIATDIEAATAPLTPVDEQPAPPPLDAVEESAEPNPEPVDEPEAVDETTDTDAAASDAE